MLSNTLKILAATVALSPLALPAHAGSIVVYVPGTADPFLAGSPNGTTASGHPSLPMQPNPDVAPANSPVLVSGAAVTPGGVLTFNVTGTVAYGPPASPGSTAKESGPEGILYAGKYVHHLVGAQNGIGDAITPINALVGVFLDGNAPAGSPTTLDFRTSGAVGVNSPGTLSGPITTVAGGVEYTTINPGLGQLFFIGDGLDAMAGQQSIVVPAGATRLFLGVADGWNWADNQGGYYARITYAELGGGVPAEVQTPEPGTLTLLSLCAVGSGAYFWRRRRQ